MTISDCVKAALAFAGKRQIDAASAFGMTKHVFNNKMRLNRWSGRDLLAIADFTGCKLTFEFPNGQKILIEDDTPPANDEPSPDV